MTVKLGDLCAWAQLWRAQSAHRLVDHDQLSAWLEQAIKLAQGAV
jgi:hypothetical protein